MIDKQQKINDEKIEKTEEIQNVTEYKSIILSGKAFVSIHESIILHFS